MVAQATSPPRLGASLRPAAPFLLQAVGGTFLLFVLNPSWIMTLLPLFLLYRIVIVAPNNEANYGRLRMLHMTEFSRNSRARSSASASRGGAQLPRASPVQDNAFKMMMIVAIVLLFFGGWEDSYAEVAASSAQQVDDERPGVEPTQHRRQVGGIIDESDSLFELTIISFVFLAVVIINKWPAIWRSAVRSLPPRSSELFQRVTTRLGLRPATPTPGTVPTSAAALRRIVDERVERDTFAEPPTCPICLDDVQVGAVVKRLPCKHYFHSSCVVPWLEQHNSCPTCRCELESDVHEPFFSADAAEATANRPTTQTQQTRQQPPRRRRFRASSLFRSFGATRAAPPQEYEVGVDLPHQ